jgi:hypothetical protein
VVHEALRVVEVELRVSDDRELQRRDRRLRQQALHALRVQVFLVLSVRQLVRTELEAREGEKEKTREWQVR